MTTSYRQVLVHLDATRGIPHRLAAARQVAQVNGAALAALYATLPGFIELPYAPELGPTLAADLVELDEKRLAQAIKVFDEAMQAPGPHATWSQTSGDSVVGAFTQQARYADLVVFGQHDSKDEASRGVPADFIESVLAQSGRPGLVIPYIDWPKSIGTRVAIAWKETPEAARAVTAAMPFLERAERVHVLAWGEDSTPQASGAPLDLASYLRSHGVEAIWHACGPEPDEIGELMLSAAFDAEADLLVMGCYGHSRAREWVLGGATRTMLRSMTLPVLMTH
jgi:nucleotide-binding universal stress UspA family protein